MRDVAMVLVVIESREFLIRRRSRRKQDLDTEEMSYEMVSYELNMTPRLRAESVRQLHWKT